MADTAPMRVLLVTQDDPLYIPVFFRAFLAACPEHRGDIEIDAVVIQRPLGKKSRGALLRQMIDFYGWADFLRLLSLYIGAHAGDVLHRAGLRRGPVLTRSLFRRSGIPVLSMTNVNAEDFLSYVRERKIDLIVSVSASQIFKKDVLDAPPLGCINLHNAPLPRYRGMLPNFWQMLHGEKESVLTIHRMAEKLDKGDIIAQSATPIEEGMSLDALIRKTKEHSAAVLWEVLVRFRAGTVAAVPLPPDEGSYFSFPTAAERKVFKEKGKRLF